jgi:oligopeptide transport system ATP-binding protein
MAEPTHQIARAGETPLVEIDNMVIRFHLRQGLSGAFSNKPSYLNAVDDVSLDIREGEVLGLVGESGSGKTTLGKALLRLYDPHAGRITFRGTDITHLGGKQLKVLRRDLQMIFQDPASSLNPRQTVRTVLATPMMIHKLVKPGEVDAKVDEILSQVGLSPIFRDRYPHELSGGQLQRVAIGRALALSPALIVADEAVSKLDVSVRSQILNLFKDLQGELGMSIIFITHDLRVARYICHRIGVMYFGKLVELAPTEALFAKPRHPYTKALLGTLDPTVDETEEDETEAAGEAFNPTGDTVGCRYYARCPMRVPRCAEAHPGHEDVAEGHTVACYEWRNG